ALIEQVSYGPFAVASFFFGMSLLEGRSVAEGINEVKRKFWQTYQVAICISPVVQTVNFSLVPEPNRVIFIGLCTMIWTCFLASMKQLDSETQSDTFSQIRHQKTVFRSQQLASKLHNSLRKELVRFLMLTGHTYPLIRGVAMYAVTWPTSNLCQQAITGREKFDFREAFRYSLFGALYVAPTLYGWIKFSGVLWPHMNLKIAVTKALIEQVSYGPIAVASFFFGMSLLEGRSVAEGINEVKTKFWQTYQVGFCVWPVVQTVNFSLVPEPNRVIFVGLCSMIWTCFLAFMKQLDSKTCVANYQRQKRSISQ
ncbi:hypothetical protein L9F63_006886, partial [Diploptera punctata]